ncbi:hypothetical protein [Xanthobacter tagetidis]|uniref:hypothetical protein n=1 Tax=Xanthobacter tagetidis TaxID=60216 RepID=UPI0011C4993E|nr:hypothetical protein [Xanthobacter tagetidis]MBB6306309.1 magnesium-transporting ATPase (P-type) [Xanthobacter tagetidis]
MTQIGSSPARPVPRTKSERGALLGFFSAAAISSLAANIYIFVAMSFGIQQKTGAIARPISEQIVFSFAFLIGYALFVIILCAFPSIIFHFLSQRFRIIHPIWYILFGVVLGGTFGILSAPFFAPDWDPEGAIAPVTPVNMIANPHALAAWAWLFILPGALGGLTYWWVERRAAPPRIDIAPTRS